MTYRSWKSVDHDQLRKDIGDAFSEFTCSDVESAVYNYNEVLQNIVDKHAPEKHVWWPYDQKHHGTILI